MTAGPDLKFDMTWAVIRECSSPPDPVDSLIEGEGGPGPGRFASRFKYPGTACPGKKTGVNGMSAIIFCIL
jgi:hypothetical protein